MDDAQAHRSGHFNISNVNFRIISVEEPEPLPDDLIEKSKLQDLSVEDAFVQPKQVVQQCSPPIDCQLEVDKALKLAHEIEQALMITP